MTGLVPHLAQAMQKSFRAGYRSIQKTGRFPVVDFTNDARRALLREAAHVNELLRKFEDREENNGLSPRRFLTAIRNRFEELGISLKSEYRIEQILKCQSQIAYSQGQQEAGEVSPKLWGFQYVTVRDERVRDSHRVIDGVTLPKEHDFWKVWYPPNGHR